MISGSTRIFALSSIVWWLTSVVRQVFFVWHAFQPEFVDDPKIGDFAVEYAWGSSVQVAMHALIGLSLSGLAFWTRARWTCGIVLVVLFFELWTFYLQGISSFFHPPIGDGSLAKAVDMYLKLYGNWWQSSRGIALLALIAYGLVATGKRRDSERRIS